MKKLLELVPEGNVLEWRLRVHLPLSTWVHGRVCLTGKLWLYEYVANVRKLKILQIIITGDAAHSTLPHLAQGAAQAVEDGAVLAVCLSKIAKVEDINTALKVYEVSFRSP